MADGKVQFNLHSVYYAIYNESAGTYSTPVAVPGAVSLTLSSAGDLQTFYADGIKYYIGANNNGYSGSIEFARIPAAMLKDVWGVTEDDNDVLVESVKDTAKHFALLYKVDTDSDDECYIFYNVYAKRPAMNANTNEDSKSISTQTLDLEATANADGYVKASTQSSTDATEKADWFEAVYIPTYTPPTPPPNQDTP